jgi:hypothetical protein
VVGHLQDVGVQRHARRQQLRLGGDLDIPGQKHGAGPGGRAEHRRAVVDLRAVVRVDVLGRMLRAQHVQREGRPHEPGARPHLDQPRAGRGRLPPHPLEGPTWLTDGTDGDRADRSAAQRPGEPADMVRVQVADQHHRQRRHPEPVQAGVHRPVVGSGVDEHRPPRLPDCQDQRVALTDVARHHGPVRRGPARTHHTGGHQHQQQPDDQGEKQRTDPRGAAEQHDGEHGHGEQHGPAGSVRPRDDASGHGRYPIRDGDEPAHRRAGQPGTGLCRGHRYR